MKQSPSPHPAPDPAGRRSWSSTLFLVLDSGTAIRNLLRTDVLQVLKARQDLRIVLFTPLDDEDFRREVQAENVVVERLPAGYRSPVGSMVESLRKAVWAEKTGLFTYGSRRKEHFGTRCSGFLARMVLGAKQPERADTWLRRLSQFRAACTPSLGNGLFERYQPALVFYTTIYSPHHFLEYGAQQRGVPSVAFMMSWDNPTSKGPFRVQPDRVIVWNELLRQEIVEHHGYRADQVFVSGVPQFDIYADRGPYLDRAAFFAKWRLDPQQKLISYTTGTNQTAPFDHEVVDLLHQSLRQNALGQPCQLLVRLHPKDRPEDYRRFADQPGLVIQSPGRRGATADSWNPTREDMFGLAELMCHSDVVVNVASTITIDAAAFDTPVVNVAYDGYATKPYAKSCLRYYDFEHYRRIVRSGGVRLARSHEECLHHIRSYLANPQLDADGRARIREEQCWRLDGQSGRRIGEYLLGMLDEGKHRA